MFNVCDATDVLGITIIQSPTEDTATSTCGEVTVIVSVPEADTNAVPSHSYFGSVYVHPVVVNVGQAQYTESPTKTG